jgi:hypothetical protein
MLTLKCKIVKHLFIFLLTRILVCVKLYLEKEVIIMLKTIKINKGVIVFYIIIALLTLLCVVRMNSLNIISNNTSEATTHCA